MNNAVAFVTFGDTDPGVVLTLRLRFGSWVEANGEVEVISRFAGSGVWNGVKETSECVQVSLPPALVPSLRKAAQEMALLGDQDAVGVTVDLTGLTCVTGAGEVLAAEELWGE